MTILCGFSSGFHLNIIGLCIVSFFVLYMSRKTKNSTKTIRYNAFSIILYFSLLFYCAFNEPLFPLEGWLNVVLFFCKMRHRKTHTMILLSGFLIRFSVQLIFYHIYTAVSTEKHLNIDGNQAVIRGFFDVTNVDTEPILRYTYSQIINYITLL